MDNQSAYRFNQHLYETLEDEFDQEAYERYADEWQPSPADVEEALHEVCIKFPQFDSPACEADIVQRWDDGSELTAVEIVALIKGSNKEVQLAFAEALDQIMDKDWGTSR